MIYYAWNASNTLLYFRKYITKVQRIFRGHLGRKLIPIIKQIQADLEEYHIKSYYSTILQKFFRGYYSRKYKHDFYERKRYIQTVINKGEELKETLQSYHEECLVVSVLIPTIGALSLLPLSCVNFYYSLMMNVGPRVWGKEEERAWSLWLRY